VSAISPQASPETTSVAVPSGAVTDPLVPDRRKTELWVPSADFYGGEPPVLVGVDAEWQREGDRNRILSYQFHALQPGGAEWSGIVHTQGKRYRFARFISVAIEIGMRDRHLLIWPQRVYIVSHFSLADLVAFADFKEFKGFFDSVRRTFVTIKKT
jgi:hypothetical protein